MAGGTDHAVGAGADYVAKDGEKLEENGGGMRLSVRSHGADGRAGEAVEGGFVKRELRGRVAGNRRALLLWVIQLIVE
jgi:hypothetical protein